MRELESKFPSVVIVVIHLSALQCSGEELVQAVCCNPHQTLPAPNNIKIKLITVFSLLWPMGDLWVYEYNSTRAPCGYVADGAIFLAPLARECGKREVRSGFAEEALTRPRNTGESLRSFVACLDAFYIYSRWTPRQLAPPLRWNSKSGGLRTPG